MSLYNRDEAFIYALKKNPQQRNETDLQIIFSWLHRFEALSNVREQNLRTLCKEVRYERHDAHEILYGKDDTCKCWFILLSGSVFIQGSMFLANTSFGKKIPGSKKRGCQCLVLEPSEMIAIDYPDMHPPLHAGAGSGRIPNVRNHSTSTTSSRSTLDSVAEVDSRSSSVESSPSNNSSRKSSQSMANGQALAIQSDTSSDILKNPQEYYANQDDTTSHDDPEQEDQQSDLEDEQEDSISLHSSSSNVKDLVTEVLKKDISERTEDDHDVIFEFTRSLQSFSNMTEPIRRGLCKYMVCAQVEKADTVLLKDNELLDSWSVIINGQVRIVKPDGEMTDLYMGESFGVTPSMQPQYHKGTMHTVTDDCQFLCIAQEHYCRVLRLGQENMESVFGEGGKLEMVKEKREIEGGKKGHIVIRGTPDSLRQHLLEENSIDNTYAEDYLLTYRAFCNEPVQICNRLLELFDKEEFQSKVTRVILLWVNNHFNDFECCRHMMELLEKFEEKLHKCNKAGECRLFNIACSTKAKSRVIQLSRASNEEDLCFGITGGTEGYPIYILKVAPNSIAEERGLKRGDQLLNVNGQNFEKLNIEKANTILRKNTDLTLTVKTNLFAFKEMMTDLKNPHRKKDKKRTKTQDIPVIAQISTLQSSRPARMPSINSEGDTFDGKTKKGQGSFSDKTKKLMSKFTVLPKIYVLDSENDAVVKDDSFLSSLKHGGQKWLPGSAATVDGPRSFKQAAAHSSSNPDLLDPGAFASDAPSFTEAPEDVIKVFRADQTYRFVFVNQDTTAEEAVKAACKEFGIVDNLKNYSLCRVSVQNENFVKQSKLPDKWSNLTEIPLSARYYLKNNMESEQLLPDENIPELLKEANYTFLDLNCFEVALHLTIQDYELFKTVEQTDFIDDLFHLNEENLSKFKAFEDLVNRELFWVVSTMCSEPNVLRRAKMIKHFTKIAHHCKALKNLNSTFAIISGLGYRAVSRMKMTWEKVPAKCQRTFEDLQALMDPSRNMSKYRTLLNEMMSQPPVIPYIPVVKKDLTFLHLGNDTRVDSLVNFEKMRMIGREVRNVCRLCYAESSQIITSALAHHPEADKPSSNIYHTLTRRGRRSSFNNARKMYEDAVNARRVKQYMQQLKIESDEDKLMDMSKQVEAQVPNSAQPKRKNTAMPPNDSPSRTSKTLPTGLQRNNVSHARNNSEPHLSVGSGLSQPISRKKNPMSSFPKFGTTSPQAIRKLLALSEESGDGGSSGSSKHGSLEQKRSGSSSSRELSPATSPYLSPKRDLVRSKGSISSNDSAHSIGHENTNRNNNRGYVDNSPYSSRAAFHSKRFSHPLALPSHSASSLSQRMSISSSSGLGSSISSLNAPTISSSNHSSSPRSSPNDMLAGGPAPESPHHRNRHMIRNSPVRSSSSSSAETVKSFGRQSGDRPVIMQGRSGSFGALSVTTISSDRRAPASGSGERRMVGSSSSPSLSVRAAASHHHLILPNHPQIPRSPSMDSGVVSIGSLSADSTRFLNSDSGDIFPRPVHQSSASLSSVEGYHSQQSLQQVPASSGSNQQSPVVRRHMRNLESRQEKLNKTKSLDAGESVPAPHSSTTHQGHTQGHRASLPVCPAGETQNGKNGDKDDDIKQTFLSGSRGWGDAPLKRDKDPWPIAAKLPPGSPMTPADPAAWPSPPGGNVAAICDTRTYSPANLANNDYPATNINTELHSQKSGEFKGGGDVVDGMVPTQRKSVISGTGPEIQQYYERLRAQERPNPPNSLNFRAGMPRGQDVKTPEAILEEKLLMELQQQKPRLNKSFDSSACHAQLNTSGGKFNHPVPLCERHSMSYSGMPSNYYEDSGAPIGPERSALHHQMDDPNGPVEYPSYPYPGNYCDKPGCKCPSSRLSSGHPRHLMEYKSQNQSQGFNFAPPARTSSPKQNSQRGEPRGPLSLATEPDNVFISEFSNPNPRTFVHSSILQENRNSRVAMDDMRSPSAEGHYPFPLHCPKHGSPLIHPHAAPNQYPPMPGHPPMELPRNINVHSALNPLRKNTSETPPSHYRADPRLRYESYHHPHPNEVPLSRFAHARSTSDVSLNSDIFNYSDPLYNSSINNQHPGGNDPAYPSPIDGYDNPPMSAHYYRDTPSDTPSPANTSRQSMGNISANSTPKSHPPAMRRKSSEWGVTDLDKENQQQSMQVWPGSSSSGITKASISNSETPANSSQKDTDPELKETPKRKKPPPPLPPQRNSSYGVTRNLRLSSSTLSPLSSPPTSPTTPISMNKLSLSESYPQLVVKTKVEGGAPNSEPPKVPSGSRGPPKPLGQANGALPYMNTNSLPRKEPHFHSQEHTTTQTRMLPSYREAMDHRISQSGKQLPSYEKYQETRENPEQISQV